MATRGQSVPFVILTIVQCFCGTVNNVEGSSRYQLGFIDYQNLGVAQHQVNDESGRSFVECGTRTVEFQPTRMGKIVGGVESPYGAFPWQVEIKMLDPDSGKFEHHCGGAVVGPRTAITAAHCFDKRPLQMELFRVVTGEHRLSEHDRHEHSFQIRNVVLHPNFRKDGPHSNDIAVISIGTGPEGIPFSSHVRPICLPHRPPPHSGSCSVTGWGTLNEHLEALAPVLRAATVPLVDHETCKKLGIYGGRQQKILDTMICAGFLQGGIDACGGDSGGPLACRRDGRFELTGLVSWGDGCGKKNRPGVYTKVHSYSQWIKNTIAVMGD